MHSKRSSLWLIMGMVAFLFMPGPSAFGGVSYIMDSNAAYNYLTATNKVTAWVGDLDEGYYDLSLGDFDFSFYGSPVSTVRITTNGYISFSTDGVDFFNTPMPDPTPPNALAAPFWCDLDLTFLTGNDGVWWAIQGTAPNRQLVVEWFNVPSWDNSPTNPEQYRFEVILYETSNLIKFQYQNVVSGTEYDSGALATVGVENFSGTGASQFSDYSPSLSNGVAIEFIPIIRPDYADYDGDGATDVAAYHIPTNQFFTDYLGNLGQYGWGGSNSMPIIWDWDGDGISDVSVYHIPTNQWFVKGVPGDNLGQFGFGGDASVPVPGDYDGDGLVDRAFYHSPTNRWFIDGQPAPIGFGWNGSECIPLPGDYDGDGVTDIVIYHIPTNQWFWYGVGALGQFGWGGSESIPVPGDYNGDGVIEIAIYHVPTNQWVWRDSFGAAHFLGQYGWGGIASFPIPGYFTGGGAMERGFYRGAENRWFLEGWAEFTWGWDGINFAPAINQIAVNNWYRFILNRLQ